MTYLQPSELRILPHSHADFTELSSGEFNSEQHKPLRWPSASSLARGI